MIAALEPLEKVLNDLFVKQAPALPENAKKIIVQYLPWVNLVLGVLSLWAAWGLWSWAHTANQFVDYANRLSEAFGGPKAVDRLGPMVWAGLAVLAIEAVIYIAAFSATRDRRKSGWDLLFYALLLNIVYGVVILFSDYGGGIGSLIWSVISSAIGAYFLFQIRELYLKAPAAAKKPASK